jgi:PmbA protein
MSALLERGRRIFRALRPPKGWEAELYLQSERFREVGWAEKAPDDTVSGWSEGMSVRALRGGRQGFAFANEVSAASLRRLWEQAAASAEALPADRHRTLYAPKGAAPAGAPDRADPALFRESVGRHQSRLAALEKRLLASDKRLKKALSLSLREQAGETAVLNSRGVAVAREDGSASFSLELMGEHKGEVQTAWDFAETPRWKDLDADRVADRAARQLAAAFGAGPLPSGAWNVVFSPRVGVEFLDLLSDALCADEVQRGKSFFAGKRGRPVASPLVTLVDDGRLPGGLASAAHDDEGCPTRETVLVERGRLKEFLYDSYAARKEGRASTGNAGRPGFSGPPSPDATNFYMKPGAVTAEALLQDTGRAFVVQEVMGMHTADPVSGDFSVGAAGRRLEKGRLAGAVKGVTLAGNLVDLLKNVDAVADDLTWYGATGAPTFRVRGLSVGGK